MSKSKFKVGDCVRVVSSKPVLTSMLWWDVQMDKHLGVEATIGKVLDNYPKYGTTTYKIGKNDISGWIWLEEWLEFVDVLTDNWQEDLVLNYDCI